MQTSYTHNHSNKTLLALLFLISLMVLTLGQQSVASAAVLPTEKESLEMSGVRFEQGFTKIDNTGTIWDNFKSLSFSETAKTRTVTVSGFVNFECANCTKRVAIVGGSNYSGNSQDQVISRKVKSNSQKVAYFELPVRYNQVVTSYNDSETYMPWLRAHLTVADVNAPAKATQSCQQQKDCYEWFKAPYATAGDTEFRFAKTQSKVLAWPPQKGIQTHRVKAWAVNDGTIDTSILAQGISSEMQSAYAPFAIAGNNAASVTRNYTFANSSPCPDQPSRICGASSTGHLDRSIQVKTVLYNNSWNNWRVSWQRDLMPGETVFESVQLDYVSNGTVKSEFLAQCKASRPLGLWQPLEVTCSARV